MFKDHFPLAALAATGVPLALGDYALFVMSLAAALAAMNHTDPVTKVTILPRALATSPGSRSNRPGAPSSTTSRVMPRSLME